MRHFPFFVAAILVPSSLWAQTVDSVTLIDAASDAPIVGFDPMPDGATINLAQLASPDLNVRANTTPAGDIGSVVFSLTGATTHVQTESVDPFAMAGDSSGDYNAFNFNLGAHTLTATPYDANGGAGGGGNAGAPLSINFTVVNNPAGPPQVAITSPANGAFATAPAEFTVAADASDTGGSVAGVEFFVGVTSLGTDIAEPYTVDWSGVAAGNYTLTAVATDNESNTTTSDPVSVTVVEPGGGGGTVTGELKVWHRVTVTFDGPVTSEGASPNPFRDYRLNVTFSQAGRNIVVPGFYAGDGNAGESSAAAGNKWRVHFAPDEAAEWSYLASFRSGTDIAVEDSATAGTATDFDGASGSFTVAASDKSGRDFRGKGRLDYVGERYLRHLGNGEYFIKGGADSPENFLGYFAFDNTQDNGGSGNDLDGTGAITGTAFSYNGDGLHHYQPHLADWSSGDPLWQGSKGKGIIGAVNYLAGKGMNSIYFLSMNVNGDGREVYPWTSYSNRDRFDCSKLDQWEVVFSHMTAKGLLAYFITQETENDQLLNGGALGGERKLYYRELVARFGHHPAIVWNLGEENTNSTAERKAFADFIKATDPYDHPITIHSYPGDRDSVYGALLGYPSIDGPSIQTDGNVSVIHGETAKWVTQSAGAGKPWFVWIDEPGSAGVGVAPDSDDPDHDEQRRLSLWGSLMAGGAGVEWYFGYQRHNSDLDCEDWRSRDLMWDQTRFALEFFQNHLPFPSMEGADGLVSGSNWCLAKPGDTYAVYLPGGGTATLDLTGQSGAFAVSWFDPKAGGVLQQGSVATVIGGGAVALGNAPSSSGNDWAVLVQRAKRILFVRGGDRTGGFLEAGNDAERTEHLGDISNYTTGGGNHGWGSFADTLRAAGYAVEQIEEGSETASGPAAGIPIDFVAMDLSPYAAIVFGSNNAAYGAAAADAIEAYVRGGGGALFISDANFGGDWCDASNSDQTFLDRFGLVMHQDQGTYSLQRSAGDFAVPDHPILNGIDRFDGEGVTPAHAAAGAPPLGVTRTRVVGARGSTRLNEAPFGNRCQGPSRATDAGDASLLIAEADSGRVACHFDRNTFFNLGGAGTDITRFDNADYAVKLISWLAGDLDPLTPFAAWQQGNFGQLPDGRGSALADPLTVNGGDAVTNLEHYAAGTEPFTAGGGIGAGLTMPGGPTRFTLSLAEPARPDLIVRVLVSEDLSAGDWQTLAERIGAAPWSGPGVVTPLGGGMFEVEDLATGAGATRRFVRFAFELQTP